MDTLRPTFQPGSSANLNRLATRQGEVLVHNQQVQQNDQTRSFLSAQLGSRTAVDMASFSTTFVAPVQAQQKKPSNNQNQSRFGAIKNAKLYPFDTTSADEHPKIPENETEEPQK